MEKDNAVMESNIAAESGNMEPSELDILRQQLVEERSMNEELLHRVTQMGRNKEAAVLAELDKMEDDMIGIVNANYANRTAQEKKVAKVAAKSKAMERSFVRHCRLNAAVLGLAVMGTTLTIIGGFFGFVSPAWATALSLVFLPLLGWASHDYALLYKFNDIIKG